jgi:LysM repeat protein
MRNMGFYILATVVLSLSFVSCGKTYKTPLRDDPFFIKKDQDMSMLQQGGEVYTQREDALEDENTYAPSPEETYDEYYARLHNTFLMQEEEKGLLTTEAEKKTLRIQELKDQMSQLLARHVHLRLNARHILASGEQKTDIASALFSKYIVKKDDTLQGISQKKYGSYTYWLAIYRFNRDQLTYGPNKIYPGQLLYLPNILKKQTAYQ